MCLTYWVHWNTLNAKLAKKSLDVTRPAAGRRQNPDVPGDIMNVDYKQDVYENDHVPKVCPDWATFDNFFTKVAQNMRQLGASLKNFTLK